MEERFDDTHLRQLDVLNPREISSDILLIGCGSIGSFAGLTLAKLGFSKFNLWDDDTVEKHNISTQFFRKKDIGSKKANALKDILEDFAVIKDVKTNIELVEDDTPLEVSTSTIAVVATDSMWSRKDIWENLKYSGIERLIDARMGLEDMRIYTVNPNDRRDVEFYENTLYDDEETADAPCSARSIIYNILSIGSIIGRNVKKVELGEDVEKEIIFNIGSLRFV